MADSPTSDPAVEAIDEQASGLMQRGIRLMSEDRPEAVSEALACFDQALELRSGLPLHESPELRFGMAACWLNRADALARLGGAPQFAEALSSCDKAIALLQTLPLGENPDYARRLAMSHHNRAMILLVLGPRDIADALTAFGDALSVLEHPQAEGIADRQFLRGAVWMNLASILAFENTDESEARARAAAKQAIQLVAELEAEDLGAAEVGLKARHALCRTFARRFASPQADPAPMPDEVHEATDTVDEGLALVRRWEQAGVTLFRTVACDLFRFGARIYLIYQPQFLQEFLDENLDPAGSSVAFVEDPDIRAAAQEIVDLHARLQH